MLVSGEFEGQVAALTGGSSGIGLATAASVARGGGRVALLGRRPDRLDAAIGELTATGTARSDILTVAGDAGDPDAIGGFIAATLEQFGRLDGLVACTAATQPFDLLRGPLDAWRAMLEANLTHSLIAARAAAAALEPGGSIVLIGSMSAVRAGTTLAMPYAVAKGAIPVLVRGLAVALAPKGIRVNTVVPGWVDTPMSRDALRGTVRDAREETRVRAAIASRVPLGRFADPREIGDFIAFVLSRRASYLTGSELYVDGGELAAFGGAPRSGNPSPEARGMDSKQG